MPTPSAILDKFTADHRRLEELVAQVLAALEANDRDESRRIWRVLEAGIQAHFEAEEKLAIPRLMGARSRDGQALLAEHGHLRRRLGELGNEIDLGCVRLESVRDFVDELQAHARHEDALLYRWCDDHLEPAEQTLLLRALVDVVMHRLRKQPVAT